MRDILVGHALRPSSLSLVTVIGINLGRLVGGAVIIETLFAIPGIGQMLVNAVYQHDHFAIQGVVLVDRHRLRADQSRRRHGLCPARPTGASWRR